MRYQSMENVMGVLPDRFGDDQWSTAWDLAEYFHSIFLRINKTMAYFFTKAVRTFDSPPFQLDRFGQCRLHLSLSGFALLIR